MLPDTVLARQNQTCRTTTWIDQNSFAPSRQVPARGFQRLLRNPRGQILFADEPETLYPRKAKWYAIFVLSLAFSAGGYAMAALLPGHNRSVGYAVCALFGLFAAISFLVLVPGSSFLRITPDGLSIRTLWRTHRYRWADIERFGVAEVTTVHKGVTQRHRMVGFNLSEYSQGPERKRRLIALNERLCGFQAALPDNYGWDHADLAEHLNQLLERYGRL